MLHPRKKNYRLPVGHRPNVMSVLSGAARPVIAMCPPPRGAGFFRRSLRVGKQRLALFCAAAMLPTLGACSVNDFGVVRSELMRTDGALVRTRDAPGFHVETDADGFSVSLGHYKRVSVYAAGCDTDGQPPIPSGQTPANRKPPQLDFQRTLGSQLAIGQRGIDVTLGLREHLGALDVPHDQSTVRRISFDPKRPQDTVLVTSARSTCKISE